MIRFLLFSFILLITGITYTQNINDNKVSFGFTQLPLIKIKPAFRNYEVRVNHLYKAANDDSLTAYADRIAAAEEHYNNAKANYLNQVKIIERTHLMNLADWEKKNNAGTVDTEGKPIPKPNSPTYPKAPIQRDVKEPRLHKEYDSAAVPNGINIQGFEKGLGGSILTIDLLPIRNLRVIENRKGTGPSTKYTYSCEYVLPIKVTLETPTDGKVMEITLLQAKKSYKMKEQKSKYDHQLYMLDNTDKLYDDVELHARQQAIIEANAFVNNQVGFMKKIRSTEIYSVKKFKNYDYSDVTNAYSLTVQGLNLVGKELDRSAAKEKLNSALSKWNEIMMESNTFDNKARINDKISAMIQCNIAEIQFWLTEFNASRSTLDLAKNARVLKAKNHAKNVQSFYDEQEKRWNVNY